MVRRFQPRPSFHVPTLRGLFFASLNRPSWILSFSCRSKTLVLEAQSPRSTLRWIPFPNLNQHKVSRLPPLRAASFMSGPQWITSNARRMTRSTDASLDNHFWRSRFLGGRSVSCSRRQTCNGSLDAIRPLSLARWQLGRSAGQPGRCGREYDRGLRTGFQKFHLAPASFDTARFRADLWPQRGVYLPR